MLSDFFVTVGCHPNLAVSMYAVECLRQLAMKFLERDELANYTFQNDFMRPFVVIMRQSPVSVCVLYVCVYVCVRVLVPACMRRASSVCVVAQ